MDGITTYCCFSTEPTSAGRDHVINMQHCHYNLLMWRLSLVCLFIAYKINTFLCFPWGFFCFQLNYLFNISHIGTARSAMKNIFLFIWTVVFAQVLLEQPRDKSTAFINIKALFRKLVLLYFADRNKSNLLK